MSVLAGVDDGSSQEAWRYVHLDLSCGLSHQVAVDAGGEADDRQGADNAGVQAVKK